MKKLQAFNNWIQGLYDRAVDFVMVGLVLVMLIVLVFGFYDVVANLVRLIPGLRTSGIDEPEFREMVANVLDVFIIVELFSIFTSYLRTRHVRLSTLLDVTIVFALRELLIKLYSSSFTSTQLIGLCVVVLILVVCRSITGYFSPRQN